ncbi:MAG: helicase-related protein [Bryobacterales bacterium]|nr:helicase-related protein [Bryobacterales bacterium]
MARLEDLTPGAVIRGILANCCVTVVAVKWYGSDIVELTYKDPQGWLGSELVYRDREPTLEVVTTGRPWSFDGDAALFKLVSEAWRIRLAYLFDPVLAVHTSLIEPLPHQITAVYGEMLPRQPLRFLLADDPGSGKTIMAGLLIKELMVRGDAERVLIVCPGNLVEQWQDELRDRFNLPFEILTNDKLEAARTGNWFLENPLAICRLDKLSRDEAVQDKLKVIDWDLVVVDEAHKMSATFFGGEIKYTKRYKLGQLLSPRTRHLLLLTATPHNGKEADFQLFLALLDGDRFEGRFRDGVHVQDYRDLMRRLVKEQLRRFDGRPLFPERFAYTVAYRLSDDEALLYHKVTEYVREEFNRADALDQEGRKGTVGFALTVLQRRLASSPEAIYQSLRRRRERLEKRLREERMQRRGEEIELKAGPVLPAWSEEDWDEHEDAPAAEAEQEEERIVDQATAARTIAELEAEIATLRNLEQLAWRVRQKNTDRKWEELSSLLQNNPAMFDAAGHRRKLIVFTEHRDTVNYLAEKLRTFLGKPEAVVVIHGEMGREERRKAQETFLQDREALILVATDAAGEGINLQRAHLMVNYDLPWNPNRLEQRFGRIHRIGQTEVCHVWNLVAEETREGDVYKRLLDKLEEQRKALGGGVFDILGKLFRERRLRDLLIEAVRYGDDPQVRARLLETVDNLADRERCRQLLEERALVRDTLDDTQVRRIREDMERAEARRLQPHFVQAFFLEAFKHLGGQIREREPRRFELTHVPAVIRSRDRVIGGRDPVLPRYERITFEKCLIAVPGKPTAAFVCPGHPLLDATLDLILECHRELLRRGAILVDPTDPGDKIRVLLYLEHSVQDAQTDRHGQRRLVSRQLQFVEIDADGHARSAGYAPYLDYRVPNETERESLMGLLQSQGWLDRTLEDQAVRYAAQHLVPQHFDEVKRRREHQVRKTMEAVRDRLTKEINYWDHRANELRLLEQAGRPNAKLNSEMARRRADELQRRLEQRMAELERELRLSPASPVVLGAALVVPEGLLARLAGQSWTEFANTSEQRARIERLAIEAVMQTERYLGYEPTDVSAEKRGYDIESRVPGEGKLRFIEVKGRAADAETITVTRNEILTCLNKPEDYILAIVQIENSQPRVHYVRRPFRREPDFAVESVNYNLSELLARAEEPR